MNIWNQMKRKKLMKLSLVFFCCNIPFRVVESVYFKNLMTKLKPDYKPPSRKYLSNNLLNSIHDKIKKDQKSQLNNTESVLLIDGWKNSVANTKNVVCTIHNATDGKQYFLDSYDLTGESETAVALTEIVEKAVALAKQEFNTDVYAIVSDNASPMISMGNSSNLLYTTCNSHSGNLLAKSLVDSDFAKEVNELLREFKNPGLQKELLSRGGSRMILGCETRWCSYRDSFFCALSNLSLMRDVAKNHVSLKIEIIQLLEDQEFENKLKQYIAIFDPVCKFINKCQESKCNIADATEMWLKLEMPSDDEMHQYMVQARIKKAIRPIGLAANLLHPVYMGEKLTDEHIVQACEFLRSQLNPDGINEFEAYADKTGIFSQLHGKHLTDPYVFWTMSEVTSPNLAALAKRLFKIPASTAQLERLFSNWSYVHSVLRNRLSDERSKKLVHIYCALRTTYIIDNETEFVDLFE